MSVVDVRVNISANAREGNKNNQGDDEVSQRSVEECPYTTTLKQDSHSSDNTSKGDSRHGDHHGVQTRSEGDGSSGSSRGTGR